MTTMTARTDAAALELPDVLTFMQELWRVVHGVERASKRMAASKGITGPQRLVLRIVGLHPGVSAGALAATLHVHPSTLTGILRRLETQGLLRRHAQASDRRRAVLRLTPRGRRLNRIRQDTIEWRVRAALRDLTAVERACVVRALATIANHVAT